MNVLQNAKELRPIADLPGKIRVEIIDPLEDPGYDKLVSATEYGPFHSRAWLRIIHDTYGHRPLCFVGSSGSSVQAVLPLVEVQSWVTGKRGIMIPFADVCEPIAQDSAALSSTLAEAIRHGQKRAWKYLELRGGREFMGKAEASVAYHAHVLRLTGSVEELASRFDGRMRNAIRKAERGGVRVEIGNGLDSMRTYYALHCATRKKHGVPPQPFAFFENIAKQLTEKGSGIIPVAWHQGVPIAAAVFLHHGGQAVYKFSASNEAFRSLSGNNLVMWEAIKWYSGQGIGNLHFGRTSLGNEGLRKYKAGWGTEESTLEYFKYNLRRQAYIRDSDRADGGQNRFLRLLPNRLFCLAGRMLYPHLS